MPSSPNLKVDVRVIPLCDLIIGIRLGGWPSGTIAVFPKLKGHCNIEPDGNEASALKGLGGCVSAAKEVL